MCWPVPARLAKELRRGKMRCPACDTPNPPDAVRCEECGEKLAAPSRRSAAREEGIVEVRPTGNPSAPTNQADPPETGGVDEETEFARPPRKRRVRRREEDEDYVDDGGLATLIPYRNPTALAGYYVGFFSLIPGIGLLLAIAAIVLSILGIRHSTRHPEAKGMVHAVVGLVLGLLAILCVNPVLLFLIYRLWTTGPAL